MWNVYVMDLDTQSGYLLWENLSKDEAMERWLLWDNTENNAILVLWPARHRLPTRFHSPVLSSVALTP